MMPTKPSSWLIMKNVFIDKLHVCLEWAVVEELPHLAEADNSISFTHGAYSYFMRCRCSRTSCIFPAKSQPSLITYQVALDQLFNHSELLLFCKMRIMEGSTQWEETNESVWILESFMQITIFISHSWLLWCLRTNANKGNVEGFGGGTYWNIALFYLMGRAIGIFCSVSASSESEWKEFAKIFARGMCCGAFCDLLIPWVYHNS